MNMENKNITDLSNQKEQQVRAAAVLCLYFHANGEYPKKGATAAVNVPAALRHMSMEILGEKSKTSMEQISAVLRFLAEAVEQKSVGVGIIADERRRQIQVEGYTVMHDMNNEPDDLICAAVAYAMVAGEVLRGGKDLALAEHLALEMAWPWEQGFKPSPIAEENLKKAGALIAAQLDLISARKAAGGN